MPRKTIAERYADIRREHAGLRASQALIWARSEHKREQVFGPYGLDWDDPYSADAQAIVELPADDDPATLDAWDADADRLTPAFVARVTCKLDDLTDSLLEGIGEFTDTPEYPSHFWTRPTVMRPRSINRRHAGIHVERNGYEYFTPDCDPWDERKYWDGSKHERYCKACACAKSQWEYAERVASGDVFPVGYIVEVWDASTLDWDDDAEAWDLSSADPIAEDSCWGFDGSADDREGDVWDVLGNAWHMAQSERADAEAWADHNVATKH